MSGFCGDEIVPVGSRDEVRATRRSRSLDRERQRSERWFEGRGSRDPREGEIPPGLTRKPRAAKTSRRHRRSLPVMFERFYGELADCARSFMQRHESFREQQVSDVVLFEDDEAGPTAILLIERITEDRWLTLEVKQMHRAENGDTVIRPVGRSYFPTWCITTSHRRVLRIASDDRRIGWIDEQTTELVLERTQNETHRARCRDDEW